MNSYRLGTPLIKGVGNRQSLHILLLRKDEGTESDVLDIPLFFTIEWGSLCHFHELFMIHEYTIL